MSAANLLMEWVGANVRRDGNAGVLAEDLLMKDGILDSLGMMSLIAYVETLLGREIPDELMAFENFESIAKIQSLFFSGDAA